MRRAPAPLILNYLYQPAVNVSFTISHPQLMISWSNYHVSRSIQNDILLHPIARRALNVKWGNVVHNEAPPVYVRCFRWAMCMVCVCVCVCVCLCVCVSVCVWYVYNSHLTWLRDGKSLRRVDVYLFIIDHNVWSGCYHVIFVVKVDIQPLM